MAIVKRFDIFLRFFHDFTICDGGALGKTICFALRKTSCVRFGKAGAHPQLAYGIAIAPETLYLITTF